MKNRRALVISIVSFVLIAACTCAPLSAISLPGGDGPSLGNDDFPLTPDPVSVSATLDTDRAVIYEPGGFMPYLEGESADGVLFSLNLGWFYALEEDEGVLLPAYNPPVTMTPVLAIDGLPFSQGFLAAVHLGPDALSSVSAAHLNMEIPGEYDPSELIGFAADGTGEEFHLFPATFYSYDGTTHAEFQIMHFSLYGVARVIQSEIVAQTAHPPTDPASQDDQELAPLTRIEPSYDEEELTPLQSDLQLQLLRSYNRTVVPGMTSLAGTRCAQVSNTAYYLNAWVSKVNLAGQTEHFRNQIETDQRQLLDRLNTCIQEVCSLCLNPQDGVTPDPRKVGEMIVMIAFASDLTAALGLDAAMLNSLWHLDNECSENAGLPPPLIGWTGGDGDLGSSDGNGPDLACPASE